MYVRKMCGEQMNFNPELQDKAWLGVDELQVNYLLEILLCQTNDLCTYDYYEDITLYFKRLFLRLNTNICITMKIIKVSLYSKVLLYISCTVYSVQCTVYTVHCTVYSIQYTKYSVQFTVYRVQYTAYSMQYTVYSVQYTVYSVQCTVYSIQCTLVGQFCTYLSNVLISYIPGLSTTLVYSVPISLSCLHALVLAVIVLL